MGNEVDLDEPVPGLEAAWMQAKAKNARLVLKFTRAGLPVVMVVACDRHLQTIVPEAVCRNLFLKLHNHNHGGINTTVSRIQEKFTWPGLKEDVNEWINVCPTCF